MSFNSESFFDKAFAAPPNSTLDKPFIFKDSIISPIDVKNTVPGASRDSPSTSVWPLRWRLASGGFGSGFSSAARPAVRHVQQIAICHGQPERRPSLHVGLDQKNWQGAGFPV